MNTLVSFMVSQRLLELLEELVREARRQAEENGSVAAKNTLLLITYLNTMLNLQDDVIGITTIRHLEVKRDYRDIEWDEE